MRIEKSIQSYIVFVEDSIVSALNKINANRSRIVFAVNEGGVIAGSLSDGDFRRWITRQENIDLNQPVLEAINTVFEYRRVDDDPAKIESAFSDRVSLVPLLDKSDRIVAIARSTASGVVIGDKAIDENSPCFIISEIANNHNGSLELARRLIDLSADAGVDCCKFQMRHLDDLYGGSHKDSSSDLGAEYTLDLLRRFQLSNEQLFECFDYCKEKRLIPMCTPWDKKSLAMLEEYGMPAYKVASADLTNHELLELMVKTGKPLICSTGMSTESEIRQTAAFLRSRGAQFVLLHCNSTYPTPFKDVNLNYLEKLRKIGGGVVGYSGHERGYSVPIAAVAMGAKVVEKHFTVDRSMEGNDHKVSLLPDELRQMVKAIRDVEISLGKAETRALTQGEMMNREVLAKSLYINRTLARGELIGREMVSIKSPGQGLQPCYMDRVIGQKAKRDFAPGDLLFPSDIQDESVIPRAYKFSRPFGIPVRYHDYRALSGKSNMDFVEFHLSYRDMDLDVTRFFNGGETMGFAVHSPELFAGDHVMDLCSNDSAYRERSIAELQRVVTVTRQLKRHFTRTGNPVIVINAGGHNKTGMLPVEQRASLYGKVAESLGKVDAEGVEIIIQTMPPFPWHFGGQSYHNLFINADEIIEFHRRHGYRVCLDISHSKLACNHFKWDFDEFVKKVAPVSAHLHIVDARGTDGEGVQIGTGDVDFRQLGVLLKEHAAGVQFIPEIWQGHKNGGEGFWHALDMLENYL
jgi:N-acetylneuraminate synthase